MCVGFCVLGLWHGACRFGCGLGTDDSESMWSQSMETSSEAWSMDVDWESMHFDWEHTADDGSTTDDDSMRGRPRGRPRQAPTGVVQCLYAVFVSLLMEVVCPLGTE